LIASASKRDLEVRSQHDASSKPKVHPYITPQVAEAGIKKFVQKQLSNRSPSSTYITFSISAKANYHSSRKRRL
jgi:hypothetical protein